MQNCHTKDRCEIMALSSVERKQRLPFSLTDLLGGRSPARSWTYNSSYGLQLQLLWNRSQQQEACEEIQSLGSRHLSQDITAFQRENRYLDRAEAKKAF